MQGIDISGVTKRFGTADVLRRIDLSIDDGQFMTLVGPSGCGKSTLLRIVAGLDAQTGGSVRIGGQVVDGLRPADRDLSMVFQSYALYPHLTVAQNIAVPLRMRKLRPSQRLPWVGRWLPGSGAVDRDIRAEVEQTAAMLDIGALLQRKPAQLSGGQRQRVALGRAMVRHPKAFLMDEPLSNLDAKLRVHMRSEIVQLHRRLGTTFLYVTHDQAEAMTMSDRVAVMMDGAILQCDVPDAVYDDPVDLRVAEFIGSPKINVVAADCAADGVLTVHGRVLSLALAGPEGDRDREPDRELDRQRNARLSGHRGPMSVAFRAEHAALMAPARAPLRGTVSHLENLGSERLVHVQLDPPQAGPVVVRTAPQDPRPALGAVVGIGFCVRQPLLFDAQGVRVRSRMTTAGAVAEVATHG
jgi:multiple sugar transport system ATP-binding protein